MFEYVTTSDRATDPHTLSVTNHFFLNTQMCHFE